MLNHTPVAIRLIDFFNDGEQTRHYRFQLLDKTVFAQWSQAQPGQFFMLNLPEVGEAAFTFTQVPDQNGEFKALIRQMGKVTTALFDKNNNSILGARGPFGTGWPIDQLNDKRILIIAGGCGLAPLVNLIDTLISNNNYQKLILIYGSKNTKTQMLNRERKRWSNNITVLDIIDECDNTSDIPTGTPFDLLPAAIEKLQGNPDTVLLCGPEKMMFALANHFYKNDIAADSIYLSMERRMHCGIGLCGHCYIQGQYACTDGPTFSWQALQSSGFNHKE